MNRNGKQPNDVALLMDITGTCNLCHHHGSARLVAYYDKSISIRCSHCGKSGDFTPDDVSFTDPKNFPPFRGDEDQSDPSPQRHTPGRR